MATMKFRLMRCGFFLVFTPWVVIEGFLLFLHEDLSTSSEGGFHPAFG